MRYALLVMLAVGACGGAVYSDEPAREFAGYAAAPEAKSAAQEQKARPAEPTVDPSDRMVIRTASLEVRTEKPREAGQAAAKLAEEVGGFVVSTDFMGVGDEVTTARVTLRVPAAKFDEALTALRKLGTILHEAITGQDVTEEFVDKEAQLRSQRKLEERLLQLLGQAANVEETLKVEEQLARIRMEIERLEGRTRYLQDRVSFSTIEFTAQSPSQPIDEEAESLGSRFSNAFLESGRVATRVVTGMIVALGAMLPLALIGGLVWLGIRIFRKRRPKKSA
jgi:hypothetical protein